MPLKSFAEVQAFIDSILAANDQQGGVLFAPHGSFWSSLSYDEFVKGDVPDVIDPNTGGPVPILVVGNSAASNLILSLRGEGMFNPDDGAIRRMPANGPPYFTPEQIEEIAGWIDSGCPQ